MFGFTKEELKILKSLNTPQKIQDFLDKIPMNFERGRSTCFSPRMALRKNRAHCMEGAMLAAAALRLAGHRPLLVDLVATKKDQDHVLAVFKRRDFWGAITKTNHLTLRFRDPVYKNIRELVMSYFNEYYLENGKKNLRAYSAPVNLARFDKKGWMTSEEDVWYVPEYLVKVPHKKILLRAQIENLRKADLIERRALDSVDWES